jgi:hypothetical protein
MSAVPILDRQHPNETSLAVESTKAVRAHLETLISLVAWTTRLYDAWNTVSPTRLVGRRLDQIRRQQYELGRRAERVRLGLDPDGLDKPPTTNRQRPSRGHLRLV